MKGINRFVRGDKILRWGMGTSLSLMLVEIAYTVVYYLSLPPVMPLFNQMPWGDQRLGYRIEIIIPLLVTMLFIILNYILISKIYEKMPLVSRMLGITTLLITMLSVIYIFRTIFLVI